MSDEGAQQQLVVTDGVSDQLRLHHKIMKLERREVGQGMALGITPDQFDRVEFRHVRWQQISTYIAAMIGKPTGDWFETMGAQTVPAIRSAGLSTLDSSAGYLGTRAPWLATQPEVFGVSLRPVR